MTTNTCSIRKAWLDPTSMESLAWDYASQPLVRESDVHMWRQLAVAHVRLANRIRARLDVYETSDAEPYATAYAMLTSIERGWFRVSTANCEHPVWSPRENVAFRIVHDVLGHYGCGWRTFSEARWDWRQLPRAGFDWPGELAACRMHARYVSRDMWPALLTECLGQVAWQQVLGTFDVQKVARLDADPELWLAGGVS